MGEKVTHVQPLLHSGVRIQIGGYLIRGGHVDYGEAVAIARRHHERQMQRSAEALAALERGDVEVHHQSGVHTPRNRRRVDPPADCLTAGCNQDDPGGWCSRCGYRPSDLPAETSTLTDKEQTMKPTRYECPYCHRDLVEVDNPLRREFRHRRGEEAQCPGPEPVEGGGDGE